MWQFTRMRSLFLVKCVHKERTQSCCSHFNLRFETFYVSLDLVCTNGLVKYAYFFV